ncbi:putative AC9 transposase [Rhizophagus clarus]|uniref:Putative AC9 transposase n=1 Tax=Rhizophagus clarus TaxID=94130 RepID=A0A8H3MFY6_9GLOM|nr:putative AC9 transposase [Rhizophagus clarus]
MLEHALELKKPLHDTTMIEIFKIFHRATEEMSKSQSVTLSSSIPVYNVLLDHLEKLLDKQHKEHCSIPEIRTAIAKGYKKLKTYYAKTDESCVYPVATILDLRMKLKYYQQQQWEQEYIDAALDVIRNVYNDYCQVNSLAINDSSIQEHDQNNFFGMFEISNDSSKENELEEYLRKPVINFKTNLLQWWKAHEATYPHLSAIARNFLVIPDISVPVERIFLAEPI